MSDKITFGDVPGKVDMCTNHNPASRTAVNFRNYELKYVIFLVIRGDVCARLGIMNYKTIIIIYVLVILYE